MKTTLIALLAGSALIATSLVPVYAAGKACEAGKFWSAKAKACVEAGSQAKKEPMCPAHDTEGNMTEVPCSTLESTAQGSTENKPAVKKAVAKKAAESKPTAKKAAAKSPEKKN